MEEAILAAPASYKRKIGIHRLLLILSEPNFKPCHEKEAPPLSNWIYLFLHALALALSLQ